LSPSQSLLPPLFIFIQCFLQNVISLENIKGSCLNDLIFLACTFWDQKNLYQNFLHFYLETNKFALYLLSSLPLSFLTAIVGTCRRLENSRKSSHIFYDDISCCVNSYLFYGRAPSYSFTRKSVEHPARTWCEKVHILILFISNS
jgi:hypothetical protein